MPFWKVQNWKQEASIWYCCMGKQGQRNMQNTLKNCMGMQGCPFYTGHGIRWRQTGKYASGETIGCINGLWWRIEMAVGRMNYVYKK